MRRTTHTDRHGHQVTVDRALDGRFEYPRPNLAGVDLPVPNAAQAEIYRAIGGAGTVNVHTWRGHLAAQRQTRTNKHNATLKARAAQWGF